MLFGVEQNCGDGVTESRIEGCAAFPVDRVDEQPAHPYTVGMRTFGAILIVGGAIMLVSGLNTVLSAPSANLLSIALAVTLGIGGAVLLAGGAVVTAVMSTARARVAVVSDTTGSIPVVE